MRFVPHWQTARSLHALALFAERTYSALELAEALKIDVRTSRRMVERLVHDGYIELVPGAAPGRRPYQLAEGAFVLGLILLEAGADRAARLQCELIAMRSEA